jgi:hypothetical protein
VIDAAFDGHKPEAAQVDSAAVPLDVRWWLPPHRMSNHLGAMPRVGAQPREQKGQRIRWGKSHHQRQAAEPQKHIQFVNRFN